MHIDTCIFQTMDKSWMLFTHSRPVYLYGIHYFVNLVNDTTNGKTHHLCPCNICRNNRHPVTIEAMYSHLSHYGMWPDYTVWDRHGEVSSESSIDEHQRYFLEQRASSSGGVGSSMGPTVDFLRDSFPYYAGYEAGIDEDNSDGDGPAFDDFVDDDYQNVI